LNHRFDEDLVAHLKGNVVVAGLYLGHLDDDFAVSLFYNGSLEIVLLVGKKHCGTESFPNFSPVRVTLSFTFPDDGSTLIIRGAPCAKADEASKSVTAKTLQADFCGHLPE
jgi:hypothetical protein